MHQFNKAALRYVLFSRRAPRLLVLGYLIACLGPFKVLEMIESVLKRTCLHIS
jgi:hypothetical protein